MRLAKIKNKYLFKGDKPEGTHTYAVYYHRPTKRYRAVGLTHLYVKDDKRFKQVKKGNIRIEKFKELPDTKDKRQFMRIFLSGATICEYDKQGRINIPNPLIEFARLEKDCIIIGVDEKLEIWSKERWEEFIANNEENLSDIADSLFTSNYYG